MNTDLALRGDVAVVEVGDVEFVFDRTNVTLVRDGEITGHATSPMHEGHLVDWEAAATILAPDGTGRWVVGIAGGAGWRVTMNGAIEPISGRLGVGDAKVLSIDSSGSTSVIGLDGGAVVSNDGTHVMTLPGRAAPIVAAARGRVAIATKSSIEVVDLVKSAQISYPIAKAWFAAFLDPGTDHSRLIVAVGRTLYEEDHGKLRKKPTPDFAGLAASGSRLWMLSDSGLFVQDQDILVDTINGPSDGARIYGSRTGGVWISRAHSDSQHFEHIARYQFNEDGDNSSWHNTIGPVFQRVCSHCHLPGGAADTDLSTPTAWKNERAEIIQRVLVAHTMPPAGTELSTLDQQAIESWIKP